MLNLALRLLLNLKMRFVPLSAKNLLYLLIVFLKKCKKIPIICCYKLIINKKKKISFKLARNL